MIETIHIDCPYCGENFETTADCSAGDQEYIEDCQVCCRPITIALHVSGPELINVEVRHEND